MIATVLVWVAWALIGYSTVGAFLTVYWMQEEMDDPAFVTFLGRESWPDVLRFALKYTNDYGY